MKSKYNLVIVLLSAFIALHVTAVVLPRNPKCLKCHDAFEVCTTNGTPCCNATFTCQPFVPAANEKVLFPNEMRCMPPNSTQPTNFPFSCHGPLEVCYELGCCDSNYICAPYQSQCPGARPPIFPCEYRCELKASVTQPVNQTSPQCMANYEMCNATTCPPPAPPTPPCNGTASLPTTTCKTTSTTTCTPPGTTTNCTTSSVTTCVNSADNSTTTSTSMCTTITTATTATGGN